MKTIILVIIAIVSTAGVTLFVTNRDNNETPTSSSEVAQNQSDANTNATSGKKLDYANKGLTEFPKSILSETSATELDLSGNNLTGALPGEIKNLKNLEILNVSNNNMTGIPAEIGQMSKLRILNYANNGITGLPNELGNLKNLELFNLSGNNPSEQDLSGIRAKLPADVQIIL